MHKFRHADKWDVWGLTAETLLRLVIFCFPEHPFPYETCHPDGTHMETWYRRVLTLPEFHEQAQAAESKRARKAGSRANRQSRRSVAGEEKS